MIWAAVFVGAALVGVTSARILTQPDPPGPPQPFYEIPQVAESRSSGLVVTALGASYSGTETLLRLRVTVDDERFLLAHLGADGPVRRVSPAALGPGGPFDGVEAASRKTELGETLVHLPPLPAGPGYDGRVPLSITAMTVDLDTGPAYLAGDWTLNLVGPAPELVADQLRVEEFAATAIGVGPGDAEVSGVRSRSETKIEITLPHGVLMLSQPVMRVGEHRAAPRSFQSDANSVQLSFEPTPFGEPVALDLGTLALADASKSVVVVVSLADALAGSPDVPVFALPASAVLSGDPTLVVNGVRGDYGGRPWVGVVLAGNWHPEHGKPIVLDAGGSQVELAHVQVGYTKDANGVIQSGTTNIAVFSGGADLARVTFVLGAPAEVDTTPRSLTLLPLN